jgi:hypothetical protein
MTSKCTMEYRPRRRDVLVPSSRFQSGKVLNVRHVVLVPYSTIHACAGLLYTAVVIGVVAQSRVLCARSERGEITRPS